MINRLPSMATTSKGIVVIPAKNEAATVGEVVRRVREHVGWDVVVIDDASVDETSERAAAAGADVIHLPLQMGAWGAAQTGLTYALRNGYRIATTMDADGQHLGETIPTVGAPVVNEETDIAIGTCTERVSGARRLAWRVFRQMTGLEVRDITSGLRTYNAKAMRLLTSRDAVMLNYQDIGVLLLLRDAGLCAVEVDVPMKARTNGHSRVYDSWWTVAEYLVETLVLSIGKWRPSWHMGDMFVSRASEQQ